LFGFGFLHLPLKVDIETPRNLYMWHHAESSIDYCEDRGFTFIT